MGASLDGLVDELRDAARELDAAVSRAGISGRFTSTYRSRAEQERLYRAYLAGRNPFPVAPPGFSAHEYGEAFDYLVSPAQYQTDVGETWVDWGGEWGGAADMVHFELPGASARAIARGQAQSSDSSIAKYFDWLSIFFPARAAEFDPRKQAAFTQCMIRSANPSECKKYL